MERRGRGLFLHAFARGLVCMYGMSERERRKFFFFSFFFPETKGQNERFWGHFDKSLFSFFLFLFFYPPSSWERLETPTSTNQPINEAQFRERETDRHRHADTQRHKEEQIERDRDSKIKKERRVI